MTTVTDEMVRAGARVMADLCVAGIIESPQLPAPCWDGSVRAILEATLPLCPAQEWQDISTAPKMTAVMIYSAGYHIGHFNTFNNKWWTYTDGTGTAGEQILNGWGPPTHWRPLPDAPAALIADDRANKGEGRE